MKNKNCSQNLFSYLIPFPLSSHRDKPKAFEPEAVSLKHFRGISVWGGKLRGISFH
ncbi:MAG: hypothetical protein Ct9H90mP25_4310 [Gammaproteobacteria bacterium]|nr:MAG: hypothetical protein Ct9H90mP25_4310 [Gammaproteobacteria bacterium]